MSKSVGNPEKVKRFNVGIWVAFFCLAIIIAISSLFVYWTFYPYNDLEIETSGELQGVVERNRDGIPIVSRGSSIFLEIQYCNNDVDVYSERYLESPSFSVFTSVDDEPVAATELPSQQFFPQEPQCGAAKVGIPIPEYIVPGVYRLKNINTYQANPVNLVNVTYYSETF